MTERVVNLSAIWAGNGPDQIVDALLKVLIHRLDLEFAAARLSGNSRCRRRRYFEPRRSGTAAGYVHISQSNQHVARCGFADGAVRGAESMGPGRISVVPLRFDPQSRIGSVIVASTRAGFPRKSRSWCCGSRSPGSNGVA